VDCKFLKKISILLNFFKRNTNKKRRNKYVGTFFSTGGIGAGQETTAYSTLPFFAHMVDFKK
jgi:hypothetical protein